MQTNNFLVAIPTHRRLHKIGELTLATLDRIKIDKKDIFIFCSDHIDYDEYTKIYVGYNIVLCNTTTATEKFNFICTFFPEGTRVLIIEDDIKHIKNNSEFKTLSALNSGFNLCQNFNKSIFGVYPSSNDLFLKKDIEIGMVFIVANMFGIIVKNNENLLCKEQTKTDYERSARYFMYDNGAIRLNFLSCVTNNYTNAGGMQDIKNRAELEKQACINLVNDYPSIYQINSSRKSRFTELKMLNKNNVKKIKV